MIDSKNEPLMQYHEQDWLPSWIVSCFDIWRIVIFELFGTALFAFGICICQMQPPPSPPLPPDYVNQVNPASNQFIPIALFFGICFSGRLTGGHLNPAVTLTFILKRDSDVSWKNGLLYMASQCVGALLGASCSSLFTSFVTAPLVTPGTDLHIFVQFLGQLVGTSLFTFFILVVTCPDTTLISSPFVQWVLIAVFFYITRTFAYRPGGMNPALAIGMDIFYAAVKNDWSIMKYIWILIIAPFIGSTISSTLFEYLYRPWVLMLKKL